MNRQDLYEGMNGISEEALERSERKLRKIPRWMGAVAAVLVVAVVGTVLISPKHAPLVVAAHAIEEPTYPVMAPYPGGIHSDSKQYEAWQESVAAQRQKKTYLAELTPFFSESIEQFLSGSDGKNIACSPLNIYMALAMLSELSDGSSRQQILDVLHTDSIEALRTQANSVWNGHYRSDGATTSVLANALWLNEGITFDPNTMKTLAQTYYASSYQGKMGSPEMDQLLCDWLNEQTGGLLTEQVNDLHLDPRTVLALTSTIHFQAKWMHDFREEDTAPAVFHAPSGDITCDFMNSHFDEAYYWGEGFSAVKRTLGNDGGAMWFLLPDEGISVQELLKMPQTIPFLLSDSEWENFKYLKVNFSLPKFDITSELDLAEGLQTMGITDVFDVSKSDFSPMTTDTDSIALSQAKHDVRVAVDEEGVTAAAYTMMVMVGGGAPAEESVDFVLDRPFLFAITSDSGLPLFVGAVNEPN